jgi:hypothetical protein
MGNQNDLQSLLEEKKKSFRELWDEHITLTYDYSIKHFKSKAYEKERSAYKASCKLSGNQEIAKLNLTISMIKENLKCNKKSKQNLLKLKEIKYKETFSLYQ